MKYKFICYRFFSRLYFYLPIIVVFFIKNDMSYLEIGLLIASYSIIVSMGAKVFFFINLIGNKNSVILGEILKIIGLSVLFLSNNFYLFLVGQIVNGTGYIFSQGTDSAVLRNAIGKEESLKVEKQSHSLVFVAIFLSGVIGGFVAQFDIRLTFLLSMLATVVAGIFALQFKEPKKKISTIKYKNNDNNINLTIREKIIILNYSFVRGIVLSTFVVVLPILFFVKINSPIMLFGLILGSYSITSLLVATYYKKIISFFSLKYSYCSILIVLLIAFFIMAFSELIDIESINYFVPIFLGYCVGFIRPITIDTLTNTYKGENITKSLLKADSLSGLITIFVVLFVTSIMHFTSIQIGFNYLCLLVFLIIFSIIAMMLRYRKAME